MRRELEQKLVEKYPQLFQDYRKDPMYPMYYGIECGDGWYDLIDKTLARIQQEIDAYPEKDRNRFKLFQVKEKFGSLRVYMSETVGEMNKAVNDAYTESLVTCVWCGSQEGVTQNEHSFVRSMCPQCSVEYAKNGWELNGEF